MTNSQYALVVAATLKTIYDTRNPEELNMAKKTTGLGEVQGILIEVKEAELAVILEGLLMAEKMYATDAEKLVDIRVLINKLGALK